MALTGTFVKNIEPTGARAGDKHTDGRGLNLHVKDAGKYRRMNYRFLGKQERLTLRVNTAVSLAQARQRRDNARELLADRIAPGTSKREERQVKADAAANSFETVARVWLSKSAANCAESAQREVTTSLEKDVFPFMGKLSKSTIRPGDVLAGGLMRSIDAYTDHRCAVALNLFPLAFVRHGGMDGDQPGRGGMAHPRWQNENEGWPLCAAIHGGRGHSAQRATRFQPRAQSRGSRLAYPQAVLSPSRRTNRNLSFFESPLLALLRDVCQDEGKYRGSS